VETNFSDNVGSVGNSQADAQTDIPYHGNYSAIIHLLTAFYIIFFHLLVWLLLGNMLLSLVNMLLTCRRHFCYEAAQGTGEKRQGEEAGVCSSLTR
jgi:hypothetical protein